MNIRKAADYTAMFAALDALMAEDVLGTEVTQDAYHRSPEESKARIVRHMGTLCPDAFDDDLEKLIR